MRRFKGMPDEEAAPVTGQEPSVEGASEGSDVFPEEYLEPLRGLMFLGSIEREVEYGRHVFVIRTLREGEILRIGQLIKDYRGTVTEIEARKMYTVAAAVKSVDGVPLASPYRPDADVISEKAEEVRRWYPAVVSRLYSEYVDMEVAAVEVSNALKK